MQCATHPDDVALFTCERCGDGGCAACVDASNGRLCHPCRQRSVARRLELLGPERTMRLTGVLILVGALMFFLLCLGTAAAAREDQHMRQAFMVTWAPMMPIPLLFVLYGLALVRARTPWRWPALLASVAMAMVVPLGPLLGLATFVAMMSRRVREVFSREHQAIIRSTPEVSLGSSFRLQVVGVALLWPLAYGALFVFTAYMAFVLR